MSASTIISLQSKLASVSSIIATETKSAALSQKMVTASLINASLDYLSAKEVLSTATDPSSASMVASSVSEILHSLVSEHNPYGTIPSKAGNIAMAVIMSLLLVAHGFLGVFFRTWWFGITTSNGLLLEVIGYAARAMSVNNLFSDSLFAIQMATLTFAPAFLMAGIYYVLAQLVTIYGTEKALLQPKIYKRIFIGSDALSFLVQAAGGGVATASPEKAQMGTDIIVAGIAIQLVGMTGFLILFAHYFYKIGYVTGHSKEKERRGEYPSQYAYIRRKQLFFYFPLAIFAATIFVYTRSIYRIIELADGWTGYLITHEIYFFILDSAMIAVACLITACFHPGLTMGRGDPLNRNSLDDIERTYETQTEVVDVEGRKLEYGTPYGSVGTR